jgi:hypothetical protein
MLFAEDYIITVVEPCTGYLIMEQGGKSTYIYARIADCLGELRTVAGC